MSVLPVTYNQQTPSVNITGHRLFFHRTDHILVQRFGEAVVSAQHMALHNGHDIRKGQLFRHAPGSLLDPHGPNSFLGHDQPEVLRLFHRTISCTFTYAQLPCKSTYRYFTANLQLFNMLK